LLGKHANEKCEPTWANQLAQLPLGINLETKQTQRVAGGVVWFQAGTSMIMIKINNYAGDVDSAFIRIKAGS